MRRRTWLMRTGACAALVASLMGAPAALAQDEDEVDVNTQRLRRAVTVNGILGHERAFQVIANANGGTRASSTPGYDASVAYVRARLEAKGYEVTEQEFTYSAFREIAPSVLRLLTPTATPYASRTVEYSGSGDVTGALVSVTDNQIPPGPTPSSSNAGCEPGDFPAAPAGPAIVLIQRGTCTFGAKARNAAAAGYEAAIIFNEGQEGRRDLISGTLGRAGADPGGRRDVRDRRGAPRRGAGRPGDRAGHHLDGDALRRHDEEPPRRLARGRSDRDGGRRRPPRLGAPGPRHHRQRVRLRDDPRDRRGDGRARHHPAPGGALRVLGRRGERPDRLDVLRQPARRGRDPRPLREPQLRHGRLAQLRPLRLRRQGDGTPGGIAGPPGSAEIEGIFARYFESQGLAFEPTAFNGRSDYGRFIAQGVPAGGLFTGAEGVKTPEQATVYGGTAGVAYDRCYHQSCDTIRNLSTRALSEMGDAAAHAVLTLARSRAGLYGDGSRRAPEVAALEFQGDKAVR